MKSVKIYLFLSALSWLPYGLYCLFNPSLLTELAGITMTSATAVTEIRAMYGGVQIAVGVICLVALFNILMIRPALATMAFVLSGLAVSRAIGLVVDGSATEYTIGALVFETLFAAVTFFFLFKAPVAGTVGQQSGETL